MYFYKLLIMKIHEEILHRLSKKSENILIPN